MLALVCNFAMAQIQQTSYRGAFAPSPAAMWTNDWTSFEPNKAIYRDVTTAISADITTNTTWTKDKVYELKGLISVRNNATLTIQAGTQIRSNTAASALVITRGAKLNAIGTAAEPIIFTSKNAVDARQRGDWGGIVLLGKARYNLNNGVNYIEGLSQNVNTEFGGGLTPNDSDSSGTLKYVRIEFAGFVFAPNNELNGLTMGAVGSGTTIENVQVSYSNDDSFEWFGGSVNCKYLVAFAGLDDDFDTDNGYKGRVQFGLSIKDPLAADISTSECFESDNNAGGSDTTTTPATSGDVTSAVFTNFTCIGANKRPNGSGGFVSPNSLHDKALRLRRATALSIFNSIFLDFKKGLVIESLQSNRNAAIDNTLKFKNNLVVSASTFSTATPPVETKTTFSSVNTTTTSTPKTADVTAWFAASGNTTYSTNTSLLTKPYDTTSGSTYTNLDYRPLGDALTGASFTDASFTGLIAAGTAPSVTTPLNYCKGVVAAALTATMTETGVSLKWYSVATGGTASTTAPVPTTATVGTKTYYVSEVTSGNIESSRAAIVVNTNAAPTVALGTITSVFTADGSVATAAVGPYIGKDTQITYTVPASTETGVTEYLWSVPLGVNIISEIKNTNSIVVNYKNVAAGLFTVGSISVQAVNAGGCPGAIKSLPITAVLPAAPSAIKMTNGVTATAITSFAKYMGTSTELTVTATVAAGASSYIWELPTGVNLNKGAAGTPVVKLYGAYPFTVALSSAPTAVGNTYYTVTTTTYASGISIATATKTVIGGTLAGNAGTVTAQTNVAFTAVSGVTVSPAYPIVSSTSNEIKIDFAGVTSANTHNYLTSAAKQVSTNVLRIGVKSKNDVGASTTANATALNPTTSSTAKLLTLTAVAPAAPAAIKMTNNAVSTITAVTVISKFIGTDTVFTLTATASALASSYTWELPAGVNLKSGALTGSSSNVITVDFLNVAAATTSLYIGVKAVNGITSSVTPNTLLVPATTSEAKLLKVTATVPAAVSTVAGQILLVCGNSSYNYTITASPLATSYVITAPEGSVVTSANNLTNSSNVLTTSDLVFTVKYNGLVSTTAVPQYIYIASVNGVGSNVLNKSLKLTTTTVGCPAAGARIASTKALATVSATEVYPNPVSSEFNIDVTAATAGVLEIAIYSLDNNLVVSPKTVKLQEGANTINENVSSLNKGIYIVRLVNSSTGEVITKKLVKN